MADTTRQAGQSPIRHEGMKTAAASPSAGADSLFALSPDQALKSLPSDDARYFRAGAHLVRFGNEAETDLVRDWFTPDTFYGHAKGDGATVLVHHALPFLDDGKQPIKALSWTRDYTHPYPVKVTADELGLFAETVFDLSDDYQKTIADLIKAGKLSWSSGAPAHAVARKGGADHGEITRWLIAEASLTPIPAEFRGTQVLPLSSLNDRPAFKALTAEEVLTLATATKMSEGTDTAGGATTTPATSTTPVEKTATGTGGYSVPVTVQQNADRGLSLHEKHGHGTDTTVEFGKALKGGSMDAEGVKALDAHHSRFPMTAAKDPDPEDAEGMKETTNHLLRGGDEGKEWAAKQVEGMEKREDKNADDDGGKALTSFAGIKARYLNPNAQADAAMAVYSALNSALYQSLSKILGTWGSLCCEWPTAPTPPPPPGDMLTQVRGALSEFSEIAGRLLERMVSDLPTPEERGTAAKAIAAELLTIPAPGILAERDGEKVKVSLDAAKAVLGWLGITSDTLDDLQPVGGSLSGLPLAVHSEAVLSAAGEFTRRMKGRATLPAAKTAGDGAEAADGMKIGRQLSKGNREKLDAHAGAARAIHEGLTKFLAECDKADDAAGGMGDGEKTALSADQVAEAAAARTAELKALLNQARLTTLAMDTDLAMFGGVTA